jgi:hypothetical protein
MSTTSELSKTPIAPPSPCVQIETLAMASCPCRTTPGHIAPGTVEEPLTDPSPSGSSTPRIVHRPGRWPLSQWGNFHTPRSWLMLLSPDWATHKLTPPPFATSTRPITSAATNTNQGLSPTAATHDNGRHSLPNGPGALPRPIGRADREPSAAAPDLPIAAMTLTFRRSNLAA